MKRSRWLAEFRNALRRAPRSRGKLSRRQRTRSRTATFELLEDRLVFALQVDVGLAAIAENGGVAAATVTRSGGNMSLPLTVTLSSSDTTEATVPASVVIAANQASAAFNVTAVNDALLDNRITVTITAGAVAFANATDTIDVRNDDFLPLDAAPASDVVSLAATAQPDILDATTGPASTPSLGAAWNAGFAGANLFQSAGSHASAQSDDFFAVNVSRMYALAGWAKSGDEFGERYQPFNQQSFGFASYDVDLLPILPEHVLRFVGAADTTLAAPLNPGDTAIHLTSAAGWSNAAGASSETRGLAWYGYQDSQGTTYADFSYTRNVALGGANGLWTPGSVSGNVIALAAPWSGPALAAGTAVRNTGDDSDESFVVLDSAAVPGDWTWTKYADVFGGQAFAGGVDAGQQFRPGTAFIKPALLANEHGGTDNFVNWRDVSLTEVAVGTTAADLAPQIVDLSVVTSADQRHALTVPQATPYSWSADLVKVDTSEQYTLSGRSINVSKEDERPLGFASLDVDRKLIHPLHVTKYAASADTTLAAALEPGDSSLLVTNASGWSNDSWESAATRALAWYGYADSTGHTYADYSYTRNVAFDLDHGLWEAGEIRYDDVAGAYRIELREPWSGPTLAAGAAIRNAASWRLFNQQEAGLPFNTLDKWSEYSSTFGGGEWLSGAPSDVAFRPGTAFIQPVFASRAAWTDVVIAPVDGGGPTSATLEAAANRQVPLDLDVLSKGAFGGAATVVIDSIVAPRHGTAAIVAGAGPGGRAIIHYLSDPWFVGTDVVTYTLKNTANNETFTASVTINVLGGNHEQNAAITTTLANQASVVAGNVAPTVQFEVRYTTSAGQSLDVDGYRAFNLLAFASDPTDTLVVRLVSGPTHGTLGMKYDGTFDYTPAAGFSGTDTFRFEAFDGKFSTSTVAAITVLGSAEALLLDRLRSLGLGMLIYEDVANRFPVRSDVASYFDANGNPYLSWRVHLLPYLEQQSLYDEFHLNEPWNSAHNLPLANKMPDFFRNPGDATSSTTTRFQVVSGEGAPYFWRRISGRLTGPRLSDFTDDPSHSLLVIESGANQAVTWTKPDDLEFDANDPLAALGTITSGKIHAVLADGSTIVLPASIDSDTFKSLVTISGGEIVDAGTLRRQYAEAHGGAAAVASYSDARRSKDFKQIALAILNYHDSKKRLPVVGAENFDDNGNPYLSWRVHILPYIGQKNLYDQFHLNEPWDSPNNLPLLAKMPDFLRSAGDSSASTNTRVMTFTGPAAPFGRLAAGADQIGPTIAQFQDGTSNTIMFVEAGADKAVAWTKPDDLPFDIHDPLAAVGDLSTGKILAAFVDGSVWAIPADNSPAVFSALVTLSGKSTYGAAANPDEELSDAATIFDRELRRTGRLTAPQPEINKLKQIVLAMHNFHDAQKIFPVSSNASLYDANGMPLLSWRVYILPYLEQQALYSQFHLNEPWDSPHNLALLDKMPDIFRSVGDPADSMTTRVLEFTGPGAPFLRLVSGNQIGPRIAQISDGTSRTIMFTEAGSGNAVPWTKPTDMPFRTNNPLSALGDIGSVLLTAMFDGSVQIRSGTISISELTALITYNGGEDTSNPPAVTTVPGFYVHQTAGNTTTGEFGADAFDVVLDKAPLTSVVLSVGLSNAAVAALDKSTLTFTAANWNVPQRVAFRSIDNHVVNPDQVVDVTVAVVDALSDDSYDSVPTQMFSATVRDDDYRPNLAGDYSLDGVVDAADYTVWRDSLGATGIARYTGADGDGDGKITQNDHLLWRTNFGARAMPQPLVAGDYNFNGVVDAADYTIWRDKLGATGQPYFGGADGTGNGKITLLDHHVWRTNFGATLPVGSAAYLAPTATVPIARSTVDVESVLVAARAVYFAALSGISPSPTKNVPSAAPAIAASFAANRDQALLLLQLQGNAMESATENESTSRSGNASFWEHDDTDSDAVDEEFELMAIEIFERN